MGSCIGIYGGTFNPIHNGHVMLIKSALAQYRDMERLILMPNNIPAYKENEDIISPKHRLAMLGLVASEHDLVSVSDMEIKRGGLTYTYDTLCEIMNGGQVSKIYFMAGSDSLMSIRKWHKYKEILKLCTLLIARRKEDYDQMEAFLCGLKKDVDFFDIQFIDMGYIDASSSAIRKKISDGNMPYGLLPDSVVKYIEKNRLYGWTGYDT
ncbi:MAG: nicotinate (nicotinamide) nucleotide adenylyltransferase [Clostridium sp.]|nr:nicotinate (nicotinamide) nucleotide adenylyltransferase [Clostridium sp.]MCM1398752.1 nicotinate (nicotinamide) nucleotide adenylyltransferase [Clostridium sp.]MCM1458616.1 nicotinate (nicotinamide) nucleotide adenylyltransferase [Bacteroides sp.]